MARMPAFDRVIKVVLTGARENVQRALVGIVHEELDRVKRESRPSGYEQFIDRVQDKPIEQIEPFGEAHFHFSYGAEAVQFALETLRALSPVLTGRYQRDHSAYVDGAEVKDMAAIDGAARIIIANVVPYAAKIEMGSSKQAPDGVYKHAAQTVRRRYGNIYRVTVEWVTNEAGSRVPGLALDKI